MSAKSLLLLATLAVTFAVCMSLTCYECHSLDDDDCYDADDLEKNSNMTATGCTYCGREYGNYNGVKTVNRTCDTACTESYTNYGHLLFTWYGGKDCCKSKDRCNSASWVSPGSLALVSGVVLAVWTQRRI